MCWIPASGEAGESDSGSDQQGTIIGRAVPVSAQQRHFVAAQWQGGRSRFLLAAEQESGAAAKDAGDACQVASDLARPAGLPLGHGAARDADGARQLVLSQTLGEAGSADARAEFGGRWIGHVTHLSEKI